MGGSVTSEAKAMAARANAKLGGRPRKASAVPATGASPRSIFDSQPSAPVAQPVAPQASAVAQAASRPEERRPVRAGDCAPYWLESVTGGGRVRCVRAGLCRGSFYRTANPVP